MSFFFFFWLQDLNSQPGTEPRTMAVKHRVLTTGPE